MPRPPRPQYEDALYHVTTRGNARQMIYLSDIDREHFVRLLRRVVNRHGWRSYSYCLMDNHYHLLVRTPKANIAAGMHQLNTGYAKRFNLTHGLTGHLFERRYSAAVVEREEHLIELFRYIALNPVRGGLCMRPEAWAWSSYPASVGDTPTPDFLDVQFVREQFGTVTALRAFVNSALKPLRVPGGDGLA